MIAIDVTMIPTNDQIDNSLEYQADFINLNFDKVFAFFQNCVNQGLVLNFIDNVQEANTDITTYYSISMESAQEFESKFGYGKKPRNKDYMYIPIINKMYTVSSISLGDRFNAAVSYWKIKLTKYSESTAVEENQFSTLTDNLITGIEEVFGAEIQDTYEKTTKPDQFQTVSTSYRDGIRQFQSKDLKITDYDLKNRWTVVSKNYYDLTQVDKTNVALEYVKASKMTSTDDFAITAWFSPQFETANNSGAIVAKINQFI